MGRKHRITDKKDLSKNREKVKNEDEDLNTEEYDGITKTGFSGRQHPFVIFPLT